MPEEDRLSASSRVLRVQDPVIPIVGRWVRENPGTISLGQGVVHFQPPAAVWSALQSTDAHEANWHCYGDVRGSDSLRSAICKKISSENGFDVQPANSVVVTAGSNMAFFQSVLAIADPGDEIVLIGPYYFNHEMAILLAGCSPVIVPSGPDYQPNIEALKCAVTSRTRAIVTISPNNPTGAVYPESTLREISDVCKLGGIYHISDEAYEYFTYEGASHFSPGCIDGAAGFTISLFSLSKAFGMAGWRTGYAVIPRHLDLAFAKIQDTNLICPPGINQHAAEIAITQGRPWTEQFMSEFATVRQQVLDVLKSLSDRLEVPNPQGAFYVLLKLHEPVEEMQLVERLVREYGVAVLPGGTFGTEVSSLRISYGALDAATIGEGLERLRSGLQALVR